MNIIFFSNTHSIFSKGLLNFHANIKDLIFNYVLLYLLTKDYELVYLIK